ncbi:MAG: glycosyltransferase family 4 protein [Gemmatimonadota bacterium]
MRAAEGVAPLRTSLRIAFLDSWKATAHEGSGTAVGIALLAQGLEELGHSVDLVPPRTRRRGNLLAHRIAFNVSLRRRLERARPYDLLVGFDVDGVFLHGRRDTRFVLCLKGVAADEARFASGSDHLALSLLARLEAQNARGADRVLVPSRYSAGVAAAQYRIPRSSIGVVPEPIRLEHWDALRERIPSHAGPPTILSVARQYPRKDTATLLRAMAVLRREMPEARLRVIGGGPELGRLRTLARKLRLEEAVTFEGAVPDSDEVRRAYFQADVFCLPSLQEGFGIVFLEAMAAGLPVVAARAGAAPEVVLQGRTGHLVHPGDHEELAAALTLMLSNPPVARRMGRAGRVRVEEFALERVCRRFLDAAGVGSATPAIEDAG